MKQAHDSPHCDCARNDPTPLEIACDLYHVQFLCAGVSGDNVLRVALRRVQHRAVASVRVSTIVVHDCECDQNGIAGHAVDALTRF